MLKRTAITSLALGLFLFVGVSSFTPPPEPEPDCDCPPGWYLQSFGSEENPNILQWDRNGDQKLCRKDFPAKANGKGNNRGAQGPRIYKDNNQPCDEKIIIEPIKKKK